MDQVVGEKGLSAMDQRLSVSADISTRSASAEPKMGLRVVWKPPSWRTALEMVKPHVTLGRKRCR